MGAAAQEQQAAQEHRLEWAIKLQTITRAQMDAFVLRGKRCSEGQTNETSNAFIFERKGQKTLILYQKTKMMLN